MGTPLEILLFIASLAGMLAGSMLLSRAIQSVGQALPIPEQFLCFLTALGADSPEIASAIVATLSGQRDVGAGVVFGSSLFNLASLLGLAAVIAGRITVRRGTVMLNGAVALVVTALAVILAAGWGPRLALVALIAIAPVPYVILLWMRRSSMEQLPLPASWIAFLGSATGEAQEHGRQIQQDAKESSGKRKHRVAPERHPPSKASALSKAGLALLLIVAASVGLVRMATRLTSGWLPNALLRPLVLAGLTGIPNLYTATRLALRHKGAAVLTEAMNSNLLNIVAGLALPALVFGSLSGAGALEAVWLLALTLAATALALWSGGLNRIEGGALIAAYVVFVGLRIHTVL